MGERKHSKDVEEEEDDTSVCKRFRGLIHILEDEEEDPNVADEEVVSSVMKSLEEEISCCYSGSREDVVSADGEIRSCDIEECTDDLNYLDEPHPALKKRLPVLAPW
ncbi:hypothetical protein KI387_000945 [Taxus chinensis]|uniref:Uncharacterized protein n=1 Tax=Taxus chinensis TaxID=29808 RepID=A0AA38LPL0_TAXCH|nr:hypothetical protein KI387_000945 [Taxus chinensis]